VKEFIEKGAYAQTELQAKFLASWCSEKGNVRAFLNELQVRKEELVQVGVVIDNKDYLSTIISSLPIALSNFASAQLVAARMFASTKSIEPEVLLSLLVEETDRQKAQQVRRQVRGTSLVSPVFNDEDEMALIFKEVDDIEELDWFEGVMCGNEESAVTEPHKRDWFFEANKGEEKSDDELGNLSDVLVEVFGSEVPGGAIVMADAAMSSSIACVEAGPGDFKIAGHILVVCDSFNMGTHPFWAQAVLDVNLEGESGGMELLLDMHGKPSDPDDTTMEWRNHAIALRAAKIEDIRPLGNRKGGEAENDPAAQVREGCYVKEKGTGVPKIECLSVLCFEGEEEDSGERRTYLPKTFLHPPQLFLSSKRAHPATNLCMRTRGSCCNL